METELAFVVFADFDEIDFDDDVGFGLEQLAEEENGGDDFGGGASEDGDALNGVDGEFLDLHELLDAAGEFLRFLDGDGVG